MKLAVCLASATLVAMTAVNAAPHHGGWHVRVHVHDELKGVSEICGKSVFCRGDLTCVEVSDWYGACMKNEPSLMEQCGGHSLTGPWKNACVPSARGTNSTCVYLSPYFSQCQDLASRETYRYKHHHGKALKALKHHDGSHAIGLYGQCKWLDANVQCADGLQCITESDHYGQCRKRDAALYDQCGGKGWKQPWSATCAPQSVCIKRDEWYSQCLPVGSPLATTHPVTPLGGGGVPNTNNLLANPWGQCDGAGFSGPKGCTPGYLCVKHNNWFSQCKPAKLPTGELCAMNKADNTWSFPMCEGTAKCVVSTADGSESRCK